MIKEMSPTENNCDDVVDNGQLIAELSEKDWNDGNWRNETYF